MSTKELNATQLIEINKLVSARVEYITPELATEMFTKYGCNNRPIKQKKVDFLAASIEAGMWNLNGESIIIANNGELIDGFHRMKAIMQSGKGIFSLVVRGIDPSAFSSIDEGTARTLGDVLSVLKVEHYTIVAAGIKALNAMTLRQSLFSSPTNASGGGINASVLGGRAWNNKTSLKFYTDNKDVCDICSSNASKLYKMSRRMKASEMCAIMLYLHLYGGYSIEYIYNFLQMIQSNEMKKHACCKSLATILDNAAHDGRKISSRFKSQLIILAWNIYCEDDTRHIVKMEDVPEGQNLWFKLKDNAKLQ